MRCCCGRGGCRSTRPSAAGSTTCAATCRRSQLGAVMEGDGIGEVVASNVAGRRGRPARPRPGRLAGLRRRRPDDRRALRARARRRRRAAPHARPARHDRAHRVLRDDRRRPTGGGRRRARHVGGRGHRFDRRPDRPDQGRRPRSSARPARTTSGPGCATSPASTTASTTTPTTSCARSAPPTATATRCVRQRRRHAARRRLFNIAERRPRRAVRVDLHRLQAAAPRRRDLLLPAADDAQQPDGGLPRHRLRRPLRRGPSRPAARGPRTAAWSSSTTCSTAWSQAPAGTRPPVPAAATSASSSSSSEALTFRGNPLIS